MSSPIARTPEEWAQALASKGERAFVSKQVFGWIHKKGVTDPAKMSNLSAKLRQSLAEEGLAEPFAIEHVHRSGDGSRKVVLRLKDGATIETVLLPAVSGRGSAAELDADIAAAEDDEEGDVEEGAAPGVTRVTQCISTQVGCAMGCVFCASGVAGLKRGGRSSIRASSSATWS